MNRCRTQCSGDALEGLKALIGCDPVFDKYRVITSNPQQPATLFTIEDHVYCMMLNHVIENEWSLHSC